MSNSIKKLALEIRQIEVEMEEATASFHNRKKAVYRRAGKDKALVKLEAHMLRMEAAGKPGAREALKRTISDYLAVLPQPENSLPDGIKNATRAQASPSAGTEAADA
ncbi:MAG: hypothetical protein ABL951_15785 [Alphaproteobacteria bacterium]